MINGKKAIAIIPARSGSKGLPHKNIKDLCGKPLIAWSIETALKSKFLDRVVLSTDDREYQKIGLRFGAEAPFLRPGELASDSALTVDVVEHLLEYYRQSQREEFEYVVLMEPTSPMREDEDIDMMLGKLEAQKKEFDAIISLGEVSEHPSIFRKIDENRLISKFLPNKKTNILRQNIDPIYFPYGVAYIVKRDVLLKTRNFYPRRSTYHEIKRYQCFEIDDIYDFLAIENIMRYEWKI
jgi:CMP-N,N'-diacetyllegionaminic acid synthase